MSDIPFQGLSPLQAQDLLRQSFAPAPQRADPRKAMLTSAWTGVEIGFVMLAMLLFGTDAAKLLFGSEQGGGDNPAIVQIMFMAIYAGTSVLVLRHWQISYERLLGSPLLFFIIVFPVVTALWSVDRGVTLNRSIAALGTSMFGVYLISRYSLRDIILLAALAFTLIAVLDLFYALAVPSIGLMSEPEWRGVWRGLHLHKNNLGAINALGGITIMFALMTSRGKLRAIYAVGLLLSIVLVVGSKSTSSLLNLIFSSFLLVWTRVARRAPFLMWGVTFLGVLGFVGLMFGIVASGAIAAIFEFLGKNAEMSGRFPLWGLTWDYIVQRPWLGFGYAAFWNELSPDVKYIALILKYTPFYSHNGVLETFLNGGTLLLVAFLAAFFAMFARAGRFLHRCASPQLAGYPLIFCCYFIYGNFAESKILTRNDLVWAMFVAIGLFLANVSAGHRANEPSMPQV